jgi:hypothetical protein
MVLRPCRASNQSVLQHGSGLTARPAIRRPALPNLSSHTRHKQKHIFLSFNYGEVCKASFDRRHDNYHSKRIPRARLQHHIVVGIFLGCLHRLPVSYRVNIYRRKTCLCFEALGYYPSLLAIIDSK